MPSDESRRRALVRLTAAAGGLAAAGAPVEVDLSALKPAELHTIEWRGKPVWILRRTPAMLERLGSARRMLADPGSEVSSQQPPYAANATRSIQPETLVTVAPCAHLGCIPSYHYASASTLVVGEDPKA